MVKKISLIVFSLVMTVSLTGCIKFAKKETAPQAPQNRTGVFLTGTRGDTWDYKDKLLTPGEKPGSIAGVNVLSLALDPSDDDAVYIGTAKNGLFYSETAGDGWQQATALSKMFKGPVNAIAIDPEDKCSIYVGMADRIFKSSDCNRTWQQVHKTAASTEVINSIVVDWFNSDVVYASTTDGSVFKSVNNGASWVKAVDLDRDLEEIAMHRGDSRILYAVTTSDGLYRSLDSGVTWEHLKDQMKDLDRTYRKGYGVEVPDDGSNRVYYLSKLGLLQSLDRGDTWSQVNLVTTSGEVVFTTFAVDPNNGDYLYLTDAKTLYRSLDGGKSWETRNLPSNQGVTDLKVHQKDGKLLYVSFRTIKK